MSQKIINKSLATIINIMKTGKKLNKIRLTSLPKITLNLIQFFLASFKYIRQVDVILGHRTYQL